jgi:hypothetical protein
MKARLAILLTLAGLFALVYARLLSHQATIGSMGLTYGMCYPLRDTDYARETCASWRKEAWFEALAVVVFAGGALVYFGRSRVKS